MLIEVFEAEKSRICWYYIIAYGISLVIVCISGAIFPQGYGNDRYCWLKPDNYFIYSFVGPVILILLVRITANNSWRHPKFSIFLGEYSFLNDGYSENVPPRKRYSVHKK